MKSAILVASFGTSYDKARHEAIDSIEREIRKEFFSHSHYKAYTSNMVRSILKKRGVDIPSITSALENAALDGVTHLAVQPTHLLYGEEYEKLKDLIEIKSCNFEKITIGEPLLSTHDDMLEVAKCIYEHLEPDDGEHILLMGHGTSHPCNEVYKLMQDMVKNTYPSINIATVEATPSLEYTVEQFKIRGIKKVVLAPLMVVAGDHALNDMASDEKSSFKSTLRANGIRTRVVLKGLGELPEIRKIYVRHLKNAIEELEKTGE